MGHSIIAITIKSNLHIMYCWCGEHIEKSVEKIDRVNNLSALCPALVNFPGLSLSRPVVERGREQLPQLSE